MVHSAVLFQHETTGTFARLHRRRLLTGMAHMMKGIYLAKCKMYKITERTDIRLVHGVKCDAFMHVEDKIKGDAARHDENVNETNK